MPLTEQGFIYNWFASSGQNYYIFLLLLYLFLFLKCCSQIKTYLYIICKLYAKIYIWERPFLSSWIWIASLNIILSRLIHFPIKVYNYFFFTTEKKNPPLCIWATVPLFFQLLVSIFAYSIFLLSWIEQQ